jgi:hypothetical protein
LLRRAGDIEMAAVYRIEGSAEDGNVHEKQ